MKRFIIKVQNLLLKFQIQAQTSQFMYEYVERFRYAAAWDVVTLHNGFVGFGTANDII